MDLYGGMFLDWEGGGELQMEHGMGSGKEGGEKCRRIMSCGGGEGNGRGMEGRGGGEEGKGMRGVEVGKVG